MADDALSVPADDRQGVPGAATGADDAAADSRTGPFWAAAFVALVVCTNIANASFATLDFEWGAAVAHFSLYVLVTALLRWLAGFTPI